MGVDSRGINRGECSQSGCHCSSFLQVSGTSKCFECNHPPASHRALNSRQQTGFGSDNRTATKPIAPYGTDKGGRDSHATAPPLHSQHNQPHHHGHSSSKATGGSSGWKTCLTCDTGYSPVDLGACPKYCSREACKSGCGKPAFGTLDLGSFGYCSAECRDRCELERAKRELTRALEEFEVNPGRGSTQIPERELARHSATSEPPTRPMLLSEYTPTSEGATHGAPSTQQPPPQEQRTVGFHGYKVPIEAIRSMSFYDSGKLQAMMGTRGILVTSIEVNQDTLDCGVQPLDLITQLDGKPAEYLCDLFGQCTYLSVKMTKRTADVWVARTSAVPSISLLQSIEELPVHQSSRKHKIVGFLVTQKDLVDPASFLGVRMDEHSKNRRVDCTSLMSEGEKAGLRTNDIIQSVTMVTAEGVVGPETEWSFEGIKRVARDSPHVYALLMTVAKY